MSLIDNIAIIRTLVVISALVGITSVNGGAQTTRLSRKVPATKPPVAHYHVVHGWPVLPENNILDEGSAVAVDSLENVLVLQRGGRKWPDSDALDETPIPVPTRARLGPILSTVWAAASARKVGSIMVLFLGWVGVPVVHSLRMVPPGKFGNC